MRRSSHGVSPSLRLTYQPFMNPHVIVRIDRRDAKDRVAYVTIDNERN